MLDFQLGVQIGADRDIPFQPTQLNRSFREIKVSLPVGIDLLAQRRFSPDKILELGFQLANHLRLDISDFPVQLPDQQMIRGIIDQQIIALLQAIGQP
jgi:hypothetical protein